MNKDIKIENIVVIFLISFVLIIEIISFYDLYKDGFYKKIEGDNIYADFFAYWSSGKMILE